MFGKFFKPVFKSLKLSIAELKSVFSLALSGLLLAIRTLLGSFLTFLVIPSVKIGFSTILSTIYIDADNTDKEIADFVAFVERTCPVADTIKNAPMTKTNIHIL